MNERRSRRRAMISAPIRVRVANGSVSPGEVSTTVDVSRNGILFLTTDMSYSKGMQLAVAFPYSPSLVDMQTERLGQVTRIESLPDGRRAVAVSFIPVERPDVSVLTASEHADRSSRSLVACLRKPMILIVDIDSKIRETLKSYLVGEGYDVIAVSSAAEGRDVLAMFVPSIVIAEIEGPDLPGYSLCAHVKSVPAIRHIPVVLTTRSAYPTDYSNAHSLGAVVCMAKPFQQERMGHIIRMLLPSPETSRQTKHPHATPDRATFEGKAAAPDSV